MSLFDLDVFFDLGAILLLVVNCGFLDPEAVLIVDLTLDGGRFLDPDEADVFEIRLNLDGGSFFLDTNEAFVVVVTLNADKVSCTSHDAFFTTFLL